MRAAKLSDADAIAGVHVETWRSTYVGLVPDDYLASLSVESRAETWRRLISESDSDRGVLVLEDEDDVIGFCHYAPSRDPGVEGTGEVTSIYLSADRWRHGGGTQLLDAAVSAMTGAGYREATLWVVDGNDRARAFYESRAWVHDGAVKVDEIGSFELREVRYARSLHR